VSRPYKPPSNLVFILGMSLILWAILVLAFDDVRRIVHF
jgi:hypothetical protein